MPTTIRMIDSSDAESHPLLQEVLSQCAREAIHHIGSIQGNGVLLAVDPQHWRIRAASANLGCLFPISATEALGQPLQALLGQAQAAYVQGLVEAGSGPAIGALILDVQGRRMTLDIQAHRAPGDIVIEIEREGACPDDVFHKLFVPVRDALWRLDAEQDMLRYAEAVIGQLRLLTGFDRVMMYRFDENWDGEVIAESKIDAVASYLGNRFPASDIPPQARRLYTRNLVRVIADIDAEPVPLVFGAEQARPVDLSFSWLRSLSPVHVEYLRNMGVRASLSISLVQNGRLWGLVACHHFSPRYVSIRERELDELIGRSVSLKLTYMDNAARTALDGRVRGLLIAITEGLRGLDDIDAAVAAYREEFLAVVGASGAVLSIGGARHRLGAVPPDPAIEQLLSALRGLPVTGVHYTQRLSELCGGLADCADIASGMMVAPLDAGLRDYIMWFRPAVLRTLRWAGRPQKFVVQGSSGALRISPRESFDLWIETYKDKSAPWTQVEADAVGALSMTIIKLLTQQTLRSREESYRLLAENSTDMIASLDLDGTFRFLSPACKELLGVESGALLGQSFAERVSEEERPAIARALAKLRFPGEQATALVSVPCPDRKLRWLEVSMKRAQGLRGEDEIVVNARDVTQRHTYQLAIEEIHRRNARILDASGDALLSLDRQGQIVYANEAALRLLGLDLQQVIGAQGCDLLCQLGADGSPVAREACPFATTLDQGEAQQGVLALREAGRNEPRSLDYVCTPLLEAEAVAGCVIVLNLAEFKRAGSGERPTEVILEQAIEAVMVTNAQGRIQSVNRAFTEITGYTLEEVVGQTPRLLRSGVHTPNFYHDFWSALDDKRCWRGEIWNKRKNGEIYPQWGSVTAVLDQAGAVKNYVAVFSDISKAKQAEEKLHYMATHDLLTGLPNRMEFSEQLGQAIAHAQRKGASIAVVFIDLDHFKAINDTLGHATGDSYLKHIAGRLLSVVRGGDVLARWGGDEFVLALKDIHSKLLIADTLDRLLRQLAEPLLLDDHELVPKASLGISVYPEDGHLPGDLIKAADAAMYRAKARGRNCYAFYTAEMQAELDEKFKLAAEIRRGLDAGELCLYYQPLVHAQTGRLVSVEALARWRHPVRGLLGPLQFIPLAEEIGFIVELGEWVLREACRQLREWRDQGLAVPRVAVNVSPLQLRPGLVGTVDRALREHGVEPQSLELEITEGALVADEGVRQILQDLRGLGVLLSVDDFGTGYSSLSHIRRLPITGFKIDKSFIDGLPGDAQDLAIVQTILALGSNLKMEVVAEGVETQAQLDCLRKAGVAHLQGYLFSRPMAPEGLAEFVRGTAAL
jgi:diguanylate cyclase (GGDEF)-like protein/PAS domain S-box-containing protein